MRVNPRSGERETRPRLLVIDDDIALCEAIAEVLRDDYAVVSAPHSAAALELVRIHEPALILLDLRMPFMDGWSFVEQYRRTSLAPARILVMSAAPDLPAVAKQLGADAHLRKPFNVAELHMLLFAQSNAERLTGSDPSAGSPATTTEAMDRPAESSERTPVPARDETRATEPRG